VLVDRKEAPVMAVRNHFGRKHYPELAEWLG
jgi:hypothetical protein